MRLWIAEKPDQAKAIVDVMPPPHVEQRGYFLCGSEDIVTWCKGHLYELAEPDEYDPRYKTWRLDDLPFVPPDDGWRYTIRDGNKPQVQTINELVPKASEIIHCGDYDREGQFIVDQVIRKAGKDPARAMRLLLRALDRDSIRAGLADLQPNANYLNMGIAAEARGKIDYIVGITMSRVYTILGRTVGYNKTFSIGRVKTPTLKLVVDRDHEIEGFVPITHYRIRALVKHATKGEMVMEWKPRKGERGVDEEGRVIDKAYAEKVLELVQGASGIITDYETSTEAQEPPLPHNLTSLTDLANSRIGMTAKQVLAAAQRLYEHFKIISYPRTDCRYLPENQIAAAGNVLAHVANNIPDLKAIIDRADPKRVSSAWDGTKIGAHHGIIPVANSDVNMNQLTQEEAAVYRLVVLNYVAQFYPNATSLKTSISAKITTEIFTETVSEKIDLGWQVIFRDPNKAEKPVKRLPEIPVGDPVKCERAQIGDLVTKKPDHFTDGSLMKAMTTIDKFVEEEEIKKTLAETDGIGTSATRSGIIEELVTYGMLARVDRKFLVSTPAGRELIDIIHPQLKSPGFTAKSEQLLAKIAEGNVPPNAFVHKYVDVLRGLMDYAVANPPKGVLGRHRPIRHKATLPGNRPQNPDTPVPLRKKKRFKPRLLPKATD